MRAVLTVWLVLGACTTGTALAQTNLGDVADAPSAKFQPADFDLLWATVDEVTRGKVGATKAWENSATGNGGSIKLLKVFTSTDGRDCRQPAHRQPREVAQGFHEADRLCDARGQVDARRGSPARVKSQALNHQVFPRWEFEARAAPSFPS